jgi:hypothetical protein
MLPSLPLLADIEGIKTVGIFRKNDSGPLGIDRDPDEDAYELMAQAREFAEYGRVIMGFVDDFVPPHLRSV